MKKLNPLNFYLLRLPSFSLANLTYLNDLVNIETLSNKDKFLLKKFFSNEYFLKAIYIASKPLYFAYEKWVNSSGVVDSQSEKRLIKSLYKYYVRMCSRPTPFGLFAGVSFGDISDKKSRIELADNHLLPIYDYDLRALEAINDFVTKNNKIVENNKLYYTNNTIYKFLDKYRFLDYNKSNHKKKYILSQISSSDFLDYVIQLANDGIKINELIEKLLTTVEGANTNLLLGYIDNLISLNILIPEEINIISDIPPFEQADIMLKDVGASLSVFDNNFTIDEIILNEKKVQKEYNFSLDQVLRVDLKINTTINNINKCVVEEISDSVEKLMKLQTKISSKELIEFKQRFIDRYDSQEVPLKEVMDFDLGIGYGKQVSQNMLDAPLLDNINYFSTKENNNKRINTKIFNFLYKKLQNSQYGTIEISDKDLKELEFPEWQVNDHVESSFIMGAILSDSLEELDKGNFMFLAKGNLPIPYMSNLLSRFAYNEKYRSNIQEAIDNLAVNTNDIIYAEIIHNPGGSASNVILRPNFYNYQIIYGCSPLKSKRVIDLSIDDLYVSVQHNRVVLRSKKFNKEVMPRLNSAHNFSVEGLPLFRFLCDLQYQKVNSGFVWDWSCFSSYDYLPRVIYKKIILCPAQWRLRKDDYDNINFKLVEIAKKYKYCYIADGDNELVLDLENKFCQELIKELVKAKDITIYEYLLSEKNAIVKDKFGDSYSSEVIFPFFNNKMCSLPKSENIEENNEARRYYPSSEWVYYKIYLSHNISDEVLVCIKAFLETKLKNGFISSWFFIRYEDPKNHLRIRLKKGCSTSIEEITKDLIESCNEYIRTGMIWDFSINTYERELERYCNTEIGKAEDMFFNDSKAVIDALDLINNGNDTFVYKIALISVDILLDDFGYGMHEKYELLKTFSKNFFDEFIDLNNKEFSSKALKRSLDIKFRSEKSFLEEAIYFRKYEVSLIPIVKILNERSRCNKPIIEKLRLPENRKVDFVASHVHMALNRLFNNKQREQEMVVYYLLKNMYNSILKRNGNYKD